MKYDNKRRWRSFAGRIMAGLLSFCLLAGVVPTVANAEDATDNRKLQNGSFEQGQTWSGSYSQPDQSAVPSWNTTAFQGKIELFKKNTGTYIQGVTLEPTAGSIAAELNADEESTLYQNVKTTPSSIYEWGLDHGARNGTDTMALVIGPKQSVNPSKPSKEGRDHLMQMVDWLIAQGKTSVKTSAGLGEQLTVYSKKFAAGGTFEDNAGNNAFSLTPSTIYTEEWHIWIMASSKATTGTNPWNSYGSNAEGTSSSETTSGSKSVDLSKYYLYTVPAGQTETLFGFVSVGYVNSSVSADKAKTYGNFLDNINFQLYHPLSGSSTTHGSAVIGGSDGSASGEGASTGHKVTVDDKLTTYVTDGEPLKVQAIVKAGDAGAGCEFVGVYYTVQGQDGNPQTKFLQLAGNEITDTGSLTEEQKQGKWIKSKNTDGDTVYTYYLENLTSATDLHFIFIKSPTITYDPNGGKAYKVDRTYNTNEAENVYSFKPANLAAVDAVTSATTADKPKQLFISPYVSKAAEGQNDGWKFLGWLLTGDTVDPNHISSEVEQVNADKLGSLLLPAVHTVACDYSVEGASNHSAEQYFKIYHGDVSLTDSISYDNGQVTGVTWMDSGETKNYANIHKGLTMVAQWRWRQAFIPQVNSGSTYTDSAIGGTVAITSVTDTSDTNYNASYGANGGKSYHATTDEIVTATATATSGYTFEGWYDASGNLLTTNSTYSYVETKESVNTYYARFSGSVTQKYIRQIKNGDIWEDTEDNAIGILGRYTYIDAAGASISSTATAGTGYKFVGWYDEDKNRVPDDMLINDGVTISYTTTGDATYYARFEKTYTVKFVAQTQYSPSNVITETKWGSVSPTTVTDVASAEAKSNATPDPSGGFLGWYDGPSKDAKQLSTNRDYTATVTTTDNVTYYARFMPCYTVNFVAQTKQADGTFRTDNSGGKVDTESATGLEGKNASSTATANAGAEFLGWYDANGNRISEDTIWSTTIPAQNITYYARFAFLYYPTVENKTYLSFVSEDGIACPAHFTDRDAGSGIVGGRFGNTISTGFKYSVNNMNGVNTIQITVTVPASAYVKVGGTGSFSGDGTSILTDSNSVRYNRGSIQRISGPTTVTYYWDASGLKANTMYGFIIDNLYAPGATATITVNGKDGTQVTSNNGVVNTASSAYRAKSHYPK